MKYLIVFFLIIFFVDEVLTLTCTSGQYCYFDTVHKCGSCGIGKAISGSRGCPAQYLCSKCVAGKYQPNTGQAQCLFCPPGKWQDNSGQASCDYCNSGYFQTGSGKASCDSCEVGRYTASTYTTCIACTAGKKLNLLKTACEDCESGTYSLFSYSTCIECNPGTYNTLKSLSFCLNCQVGQFSNKNASTTCSNCLPGTFNTLNASTTCLTCPIPLYSIAKSSTCFACSPGNMYNSDTNVCSQCDAGTYSNIDFSSACLACPTGSISSAKATVCTECILGSFQNSESSCQLCTPGTYTSKNMATFCEVCVPGFYNVQVNSTFCFSCLPGNYNNLNTSTSCSQCLPGTYNSLQSSTLCYLCIPGKYIQLNSSTSCLFCANGSYSSGSGEIVCKNCSAGRYVSGQGEIDCTNICNPGTYSLEGSFQCLNCSSGFFNPNYEASFCFVCTDCGFGRYHITPCTQITDTTCDSCYLCPIGTYETRQCFRGSYNVLGYNRQCEQCSTCTNDTYKSGGCVNGEALVCSPCSICLTGIFRACTPFSNAVCVEGIHCRKNYTFKKYEWISETETCSMGQYLVGMNVSENNIKTKLCSFCPFYLVGLNGLWCEPCKGYKVPYWDSTACVCNENTVANEFDFCVCPPGHSFDEKGCVPCPPNKYNNFELELKENWFNQRKKCELCPDGQYTLQGKSLSCSKCEPGKYRVGDMYLCMSCPVGQYAMNSSDPKSCTDCSTFCNLGYYSTPCPQNPKLFLCQKCPDIPQYAMFTGNQGDMDTSCAWKCPKGLFRSETLTCEICSDQSICSPGYNFTMCTEVENSRCNTECVDPQKPRNSVWKQDCKWECDVGYEKRFYDYVLWSSYDCAPIDSYTW